MLLIYAQTLLHLLKTWVFHLLATYAKATTITTIPLNFMYAVGERRGCLSSRRPRVDRLAIELTVILLLLNSLLYSATVGSELSLLARWIVDRR